MSPTDVHVMSENSSEYPTAYTACASALRSSEPMKRSNRTPAMFIAMPWKPVGSPNRNNDRMIPQSGRQFIPRCQCTTSRPEQRRYTAITLTTPPATAVPTAAPAVPMRGTGPSPRMQITLNTMLSTVSNTPSRNPVCASPAERKAPPTMKKSSIPMLKTNITRRYGRASARTASVACTRPSSEGASTNPRGARTASQSPMAARNAWYTVRFTFSTSPAPANRATSTPIPLKIDVMNTMTTRKI